MLNRSGWMLLSAALCEALVAHSRNGRRLFGNGEKMCGARDQGGKGRGGPWRSSVGIGSPSPAKEGGLIAGSPNWE
eukprot:scaffold5688_cov116-Isochrysis_galbana.AAC.16